MVPDASAGGETALRQLADRVGILPAYRDLTHREHITTDETRMAILRAMGMDGSSERRAAEWLGRLDEDEEREVLAPVRVVELDTAEATHGTARLRLQPSAPVDIEMVDEHGTIHSVGAVARQTAQQAEPGVSFAIPRLPLGYHTLRLRATDHGREVEAVQSLIVVPARCTSPAELLRPDAGPPRAFGVIANLYSVHSERNWGVGDFTDLSTLARWTARAGGDFVGVNPLHALLSRGGDVSPYSPVSRLFRNAAYVDVEAIPELRDVPRMENRLASAAFLAELALLRERRAVDYEHAMALKTPVLEELHRAFLARAAAGGTRAAGYARYRAANEPELTAFATWMAIADLRGESDWHRWPAALWDPHGASVQAFQREHQDRVDYHRWLQFELDRQLEAAAAAAAEAGMRVGLYQDLAVGSSPTGSDTWSNPDLFVPDASVGAPPDPLATGGQNWGLPPMDPRRLRRTGYRHFIRLLRQGFQHAGALRLDHVMGLFRLFWIPRGMSGNDGAYVRYPSRDLLGILALESVRHRALVVGEDLGTVPADVPPALEKWGVLSSKVLYFERNEWGGFRPPADYDPRALATANTHDLPTLAGFWTGRDIAVRARTGALPNAHAVTEALEERARDRDALVRALEDAGTLDGIDVPAIAVDEAAGARFRGAVHEYLCRTPSALVGLALDDVMGEVDAVNVPGVGPESHPNWTRKMRLPLEELPRDAGVEAALACGGRGARARP